MKKFDIDAAKAGAKVITRDRREVRIILYDRISHKCLNYPIVALINHKDGEFAEYYGEDGIWRHNKDESGNDLVMAPVVVKRWVNVFPAMGYDSEQEAIALRNEFAKGKPCTTVCVEVEL